MFSRRRFIHKSLLGSLLVGTGCVEATGTVSEKGTNSLSKADAGPMVISTWDNQEANKAAWEVLARGGSAVDAVEQGVRVPEGDPKDQSVGYGGRPDRDGKVTLDACIMDSKGNAGSVCFLQEIKHPISVARKVMDDTPHVILSGNGALQFALANGFEKENLLTETSRLEWEAWKKKSLYKPIINIENHDTIGMLAMDANGDLSGACTTSGLAYKMSGRVGDSPIIGAGLFVDNEIGAATATGMGEAVLKSCGSFLVVELMRQGRTPAEACKEAVMRIVKKQDNYKDIQVGYLAMNKAGELGAFCIYSGFEYVLTQKGKTSLQPSSYHLKSPKTD